MEARGARGTKMSPVFQPNVSLNEAIFNACDALCVLAGTERPVWGVDSLTQTEKKGAAAIVALQAAGIPTPAEIAALTAALAAEVAARIAADTVLTDDLDDEIAARIAADANLQAQITACCSGGGGGDSVLTWMNL